MVANISAGVSRMSVLKSQSLRVETPQSTAGKRRVPFVWLDSLRQRLRLIWMGELDLGRVGLLISVPVLCWVFYTTSSGMVDIMQKEPGDWVGLIGAGVATTAVLVMLTSTSWSLGSDLAALIARRRMARERVVIKTLVTAVVFLFVFSISAFFSFTYYYNNIFKLSSKKIVAELQPMELAADVILPTTNEIAARYNEASAKIIATPSFKAYLESLDAQAFAKPSEEVRRRSSKRVSQRPRRRPPICRMRRMRSINWTRPRTRSRASIDRSPVSTPSSKASRTKSAASPPRCGRRSRNPSTRRRASTDAAPPAERIA
jgi:hypothetical protein